MIFIDDLKQFISIIRDPESNTKNPDDVVDVFLRYYKATLIPIIVVSVIEVLLSGVVAVVVAQLLESIPVIGALIAGLAGLIASFLLVFATVFLIWVAVPIGLFGDSVMFHIFGKYVFKKFDKDFDATATAVVYSGAPFVLFSWVVLLPLLGIWLFLLLVGWKYAIMISSLSNQQKIDKKSAGWVIFFTWIVVGIVGLLFSLVI
jgi:hypothetical protein